MNTLTRNGKTFTFTTTEELLTLPLVTKFTDDPAFIRLGSDGKTLVAYECVPVMRIIGQLAQPVILPKTIQGSSGRKGLNP